MKIRIPIKKDKNNIKIVTIRKGNIAPYIVAIFFVLSALTIYGFYTVKNVENLALVQNSRKLSSNTDDYLSQISKKIWLPEDSIPPRIFKISDPNPLITKQSFYKGAQTGDVLVVFDESRRAILYSPERDVIINTGLVRYNNSIDNTRDLILSENATSSESE